MWLKLTLVSLKHIAKKIKAFYQKNVKTFIWLYLTILVVINSFILGFLSNLNKVDNSLFKIEYDSSIEITKDDLLKEFITENGGGDIYASKNGTKYYFNWCGNNRIKDENKIYFENEDRAREEGYELSANCN